MTPLKHGSAKVRFVHAGGSVSDAVQVKLDKLSIDLKPFETVEYRKIPSKEYNIRLLTNGTREKLGSVCCCCFFIFPIAHIYLLDKITIKKM